MQEKEREIEGQRFREVKERDKCERQQTSRVLGGVAEPTSLN